MITASLLALCLGATPPPVLTLDQAFQEARANNLDLKVARARLDQSMVQQRQALAGYLPTVLVGGSYTRNSAEAVLTLPGGGPTVTIQPFNALAAQAEVRQALIAPALWPAIRNAGIAQEVATLSTENVRREVLFGVAQIVLGVTLRPSSVRQVSKLSE